MSFGSVQNRTTPLQGNLSAQIVINLHVGNIVGVKISSAQNTMGGVDGWQRLPRELQCSLNSDDIAFYTQPFVSESKPSDVLSVLNNFTELNKKNMAATQSSLRNYFKTECPNADKAKEMADSIFRHYILRNLRIAGIVKYDREQRMGSRDMMDMHSMNNNVTIALSAFAQKRLFGPDLVGQRLYAYIPIGTEASTIGSNMIRGDYKREGIITVGVCAESKLDWMENMKHIRQMYLTGNTIYTDLFPPGQRGQLAPYHTWQKAIDDDVLLSGLALVRALLDMGVITVPERAARKNKQSAIFSITEGDDLHASHLESIATIAVILFPELSLERTSAGDPTQREALIAAGNAIRSATLLTKDSITNAQRAVYSFGSYWDGHEIKTTVNIPDVAKIINKLNEKLGLHQMAQVRVGFDMQSSMNNLYIGKQISQANGRREVDVSVNLC